MKSTLAPTRTSCLILGYLQPVATRLAGRYVDACSPTVSRQVWHRFKCGISAGKESVPNIFSCKPKSLDDPLRGIWHPSLAKLESSVSMGSGSLESDPCSLWQQFSLVLGFFRCWLLALQAIVDLET